MTLPVLVKRSLSVLAGVLAGGTALVSEAEAARGSRESGDSGPVLMSRTAGGSMWANLKELEEAAAKGNPKAQTQLGEMLLRGDGVAKNAVRGVALLEKAARAGNSTAAFRIGMLLMNGESGVAQDPARALAYFRAAAAGGEKEAFFNIGAAYASGRGVKRDYGEALGWLIVARQHGADPSTENALRERIKSHRPWIAKGERRAKEIEAEFAGKKVVDLLPPAAPLDRVAEPPPEPDPLRPAAAGRSSEPLRPKPATDALKPSLPSLPALPPPAIK